MEDVLSVEYLDEICKIQVGEYNNGGLIALQLIDEWGMPVATCTCNSLFLEKDEVAIKNWSENYGIYEALLDSNIIEEKHRNIDIGYNSAPVCRLSEEVLTHIENNSVY